MLSKNVVVRLLLALALLMAIDSPVWADHEGQGWMSLFDGETLDGWVSNEGGNSFRVEDGVIVLDGPRSHLFYMGPVGNHDFKDFELKLEVMAEPGANSGIYFQTEYQDEGWLDKGYEAQVNNTQGDWRRTGSLYGVENIPDSPVVDNEWFDYRIVVKGKQIKLYVNGELTVNYTEPEDPPHLAERPGRLLSSGTIALQAHDPGSVAYFRNIRIRPLPYVSASESVCGCEARQKVKRLSLFKRKCGRR